MIRLTRQDGFTLIEVLIALVVLSLLSAGMVSLARFGTATLHRVRGEAQAADEIWRTARALRSILATAYPFQPTRPTSGPFGLESDGQSLTVSAASFGRPSGWWRYVLSRDTGTDSSLRISWVVDRNGTVDPSTSPAASTEVLLPHVQGLHVRFLAPSDLSDPRAKATWQDQWHRPDLPQLIDVQVEFPAGDKRWWPPLWVAPRLTDSAQCQFDPVAQRCRPVPP